MVMPNWSLSGKQDTITGIHVNRGPNSPSLHWPWEPMGGQIHFEAIGIIYRRSGTVRVRHTLVSRWYHFISTSRKVGQTIFIRDDMNSTDRSRKERSKTSEMPVSR
jgi:hypothetical protein